MRLSPHQLESIRTEVHEIDPTAEVFLYGSRTDDSIKGGDIDLLVVSDHIAFRDLVRLRTRIMDRIGWQQLDLVVRPRHRLHEPLAAMAQASGIKL